MAESSQQEQVPKQDQPNEPGSPFHLSLVPKSCFTLMTSSSMITMKEAFTRTPNQYKEYLFEFWYTAKPLKNSKVWFSTPTGGILGEVRVTTFKNAIGANYLSHSTEYAEVPSLETIRAWFLTIGYSGEIEAKRTLKKNCLPPSTRWKGYGNDNVTLNPTQVFSVHNWALKKNQDEGSPFIPHMLAICNADEPVVFKAPRTSSKAEKKVTQGTKPGAKSGRRK
ncbi:hypothetical protein Tco_1569915 [Tanacetum coccineum]